MTTPSSRSCFPYPALLGFGLLLASGCDTGPTGSGGVSGLEVMRNTVEYTIVPDIAAFRASAQSLQIEVDAFCAAPTAEGLEALQVGWSSLSESWNAVAAYNLGPLDDDVITPKIIFIESMRQRGTDYTQTVRDAATVAIAGTEPLDDASFAARTFDEVGMLALEVLVFEDSREGHSTVPDDILDDYVDQPRKCEYLGGMARLLARHAAEVDDGWSLGFGDSGEPFKETMAGPSLADGSEPVVELLLALHEHLDYIKVRKLEGILDAQLSGHFYPNVLATLDALERLLVQPAPDDSFGMLDFMEGRGFTTEVAAVEANLAMAKSAAAGRDLEALIAAIERLEGNLKGEIPMGLGLQLGITFSDGD